MRPSEIDNGNSFATRDYVYMREESVKVLSSEGGGTT